MNHGERVSLAFGPPFLARGSARRSAPFLAPPPFEEFREASRRGGRALTLTASARASTNQKRAALPPSLHTKRGKIGGKKPHRLRESFCFPRAFSDGFRRGNRRSVVRGGWRSQAGVVAKMVVVVVGVI